MENQTSTTSKLALLRKARNLSQQDVASYLGLPVELVEEMEAGERKINVLVANKLAEYFNVAPTYLIQEEPKPVEKKEVKPLTIGEKIVMLRKSRGLTQADVGSLLNISYQAVSKWERDESCPDFETLSKLAQFFNVSVSYFEKDGENAQPQSDGANNVNTMIGVCTVCGKALSEDEVGERYPKLLCTICTDRKKRIQKQQEEAAKQQKEKQRREAEQARLQRIYAIKRSRNKGLIWAAVLTGIILLIGLICMIANQDEAGTIVVSTVVIMVFAYPFVSQLFWDGAVVSCTLAGGKVIGTPGVIFTFDLDGFIFLIAMKILFAVLKFLVWMLTIIGCALVAILISPITFFPALHRVNSGDLLD